MNFSESLQTKTRVDVLERRLRYQLKQEIAFQSAKKVNGKNNCLKEVTEGQLQALRNIAHKDYDDRFVTFTLCNYLYLFHFSYDEERVDYGEMYMENLFHLLFEKGCKSKKKLQTTLDKLLKRLEKHCKRQCRVFGLDYFFHYAEDEPNDYFQSYYGGHYESEEELGDEIVSLTSG